MSYDAINRRSNVTSHHGGGKVILESLKRYTDLGLDSKKLNIGFPMYAKVFSMAKAIGSDCPEEKSIGCSMGTDTFEDPADGSDKGALGAILFREDLNTAAAIGPPHAVMVAM
jgi:chitinase